MDWLSPADVVTAWECPLYLAHGYMYLELLKWSLALEFTGRVEQGLESH